MAKYTGLYGMDLTPEEEAAGFLDISQAAGTPTYGIPEFEKKFYASRDYGALPSMYELYLGGGFPGADTAQIPGAIDTLVDTGAGDAGTRITGASAVRPTGGVNTPEQQRLIDEGIGVQLSPGQPISHPAEGMPRTQAELDEFNRIPVSTDYTDPYTSLGMEEGRLTYAEQLQQLQDEQALTNLERARTGQSNVPTYIGGERTLADAGGIEELGGVMGPDYPGEEYIEPQSMLASEMIEAQKASRPVGLSARGTTDRTPPSWEDQETEARNYPQSDIVNQGVDYSEFDDLEADPVAQTFQTVSEVEANDPDFRFRDQFMEDMKNLPSDIKTALTESMDAGLADLNKLKSFLMDHGGKEIADNIFKIGDYTIDVAKSLTRGAISLIGSALTGIPGMSLILGAMEETPLDRYNNEYAVGGKFYNEMAIDPETNKQTPLGERLDSYSDQLKSGNLPNQDPFGINTTSIKGKTKQTVTQGNYPAYATETYNKIVAKEEAGEELGQFEKDQKEYYGKVSGLSGETTIAGTPLMIDTSPYKTTPDAPIDTDALEKIEEDIALQDRIDAGIAAADEEPAPETEAERKAKIQAAHNAMLREQRSVHQGEGRITPGSLGMSTVGGGDPFYNKGGRVGYGKGGIVDLLK